MSSQSTAVSSARRSTTTSRVRATRSAKQALRTATKRDALLRQHVGLVHHVARQLAQRLSTEANVDELVSAGALGLVQAAHSFDPSRGLSFSTFAVPRIRGAILDELRNQDHASRGIRRRSRELARAKDVLTAKLERTPSLDEVSSVLGVPANTIRQWELDIENTTLCSLDQPQRAELGSTLGESIDDDDAPSIEDILSREQEVEQLKAAVARLNEQERTVLALNYFEELKLQEIATILGLSICRISQVRTAALAKLRASLIALRAA